MGSLNLTQAILSILSQARSVSMCMCVYVD